MRNKYVVRVDPQGQTMVVDVLDMAGVSVPAYDSPQFAAAARVLPLTITTQTDFCLASPGAYDVSCKVGGSEVAEAGAPKRVRLTDVPVLVTPDWERQRTAASAASSAPGAVSVIKIPFAFDSAGISSPGGAIPGYATGYTPAIGDVLLDAFCTVTTPFTGGTDCKADIGYFADGFGIFGWTATAVPLDVADSSDGAGPLPVGFIPQSPSVAFAASQQASDFMQYHTVTGPLVRALPAPMVLAQEFKIVVSSDGSATGTDPAATAGAGIFFLVVATPANPS